MRRRILLANPPTYAAPGSFFRPVRFPAWQYASPVQHPPLYLLSAATSLREHGGHEIAFVDAQAPGLGVDAFVRRAASLRPDLAVLETCLASFDNDRRVASALREATGCRVVLCGPQLAPEVAREVMGHPEIDAAVIGEYEATLLELAASGLAPGVPGALVRAPGGEVVEGPPRAPIADLDALPDPDQSLLHHRAYYDPVLRNPFAYFLSARGCPHRCTFCSWPQTFTGRAHRRRSPARVAGDVARTLAAAPHLRSFLFNDDTFTADREHALAVCAALAARGVRPPWGCYVRADLDDEEVLRALRGAGCELLKVGVESADARVLERSGKGYDLGRVEAAIARMKRLGFRVHASFAFGLPGETEESIRATVAWACRAGPTTAQFSTAVPYPGTAFHAWLRREGHLRPHRWSDLGRPAPVFEYPELPRDRLAAAVPLAYRRFYFRPSQLLRAAGRVAREPRAMPALVTGTLRLLSPSARAGEEAA
jgi:radical SAM superfamily enzyme YgiQ (UPF0313 family)